MNSINRMLLVLLILLGTGNFIIANDALNNELTNAIILGKGITKVQELIDAGADVNTQIEGSNEKWTPLIAITLANYDGITEDEREAIARALIEAGADINAQYISDRPDMNNKTALELAQEHNKTGVIKVLEKQKL